MALPSQSDPASSVDLAPHLKSILFTTKLDNFHKYVDINTIYIFILHMFINDVCIFKDILII